MKYTIATNLLILFFFSCIWLPAQTQVEIHQINVGNGDGALIKFYDKDKMVYSMVIDGGLKSGDNDFVPYLKKFIPDMEGHAGKKEVDWVILSHNHQDHFKGLMEMFKDDTFVIRELTDQGGYDIGDNAYPMPLKEVKSTNSVPFITRDIRNKKPNDPQPTLTDYIQSVKTANDNAVAFDGTPIKREIGFDTTAKTFKAFDLPAIGGIRPSLYFIATNGYTKGTAGRLLSGAASNNYNANNFCYAWILEYGQFRYYSGGDMGGAAGSYIDQETPISTYLKTFYLKAFPLTGATLATSYPGHVCVVKTNHHGSTKSSNATFLKTLSYSALVTSAGKHSSWKIPTVKFVNRVADNPLFGAKTGVYFTQLYNYSGNQSLTVANSKFAGKADYDYISPGADQADQYSYIFLILPNGTYAGPPSQKIDITKKSLFKVFKVKTSDHTVTAQFTYLCHKPS